MESYPSVSVGWFYNENMVDHILTFFEWDFQRVDFKGEKYHENNAGFFFSSFARQAERLIMTDWSSGG